MGREQDAALHGVVVGRFGALRRSAYLMCGDWTLAGDLAADVLAALVVTGGTRRSGDLDASARRAMTGALLTGWRRRLRRRERVFSGGAGPGDGGQDPVVPIAVLAALSRLRRRRRAVVVLRHWEGLSVSAVADVLGTSARAVAVQEARGLATVRDALGALLPPSPPSPPPPSPSAAPLPTADSPTANPSTVDSSGTETSGTETSGTETSGIETSGAEVSGAASSGAGAHAVDVPGAGPQHRRHRRAGRRNSRHLRQAASRHRRSGPRRAAADGTAVDREMHELFARVLVDEPPPGDAVSEVYRRAERRRRRRIRAAVGAGAGTVLLVALAGYGLVEAVLPRAAPALLASGRAPSDRAPSDRAPSDRAASDPVAAGRLDPGRDRVRARLAARVAVDGARLDLDRAGVGWRRYAIVAAAGSADDAEQRERGTVQVVTYTAPGGMCFPVPSAPEEGCAPVERAGGIEFVRYSGDGTDAPFHQVIARRVTDGRTVAVVVAAPSDAGAAAGGPGAAGPREPRAGEPGQEHQDGAEPGQGEPGQGEPGQGEPGQGEPGQGEPGGDGAGEADAGAVPPLTARQVAEVATDPGLPDAFGPDEWCDRVDPGCPELRVPLLAEAD